MQEENRLLPGAVNIENLVLLYAEQCGLSVSDAFRALLLFISRDTVMFSPKETQQIMMINKDQTRTATQLLMANVLDRAELVSTLSWKVVSILGISLKWHVHKLACK